MRDMDETRNEIAFGKERGACGIFVRGLEAEMRHPSLIAEYVRIYHDERKRLSARANAKRAYLELRHGELNREIDRLVDAIAKGHGDPAVLVLAQVSWTKSESR